jgi:hypothetical protein
VNGEIETLYVSSIHVSSVKGRIALRMIKLLSR